MLFISVIVWISIELVVYFISKKITKWIIKPAVESFNKQKDFIADASHELKTPLAVIMASADELKSDKKNAKYIENIKFESDRMNKLITGLLDLSKLENETNINNYKEENISKIVEKISLTFEGIAFENNLNIESDIEKNIMFKCSKDEIEKLISILLDNAIKHSYKESVIHINLFKEKNSIIIEVKNNGNPINPGDEEKIFERFYRADKSRNRDANRYGLGLAIAKNIVTNYNGFIKASSSDGILRIWDYDEPEIFLNKIKTYYNQWLVGIDVINDRFLIAGCGDGTLKEFDLKKNFVSCSLERKNYKDSILAVQNININGKDYLFSHSFLGRIEVWNY